MPPYVLLEITHCPEELESWHWSQNERLEII